MRAAGRLFSRKGYAGTSIDEIATAAKASPSSIYWHFKGGKDDLLLAVLEEATSFYTATMLVAVRRGDSLAVSAQPAGSPPRRPTGHRRLEPALRRRRARRFG